MKTLVLSLCFLVLTCCNRMCADARDDMTPEQVVEAYLDISLNMSDPNEKDSLLDLTTGILRSSINSASAETIIKAFVNRNYKLKTYSVMERRDRTPRETEITFLLVYRDLGENPEAKEENAPEISTENTVAVIKEKGTWYIRDVIGKRTTIDFPTTVEVIKPGTKKQKEDDKKQEVEPEK
jgi:hypothetical protein